MHSTLKQWIYKGSVRTAKTDGGHHRVPDTEVQRLLAAQDRLPPARPRRAASPGPGLGRTISISGRNQLRGVIEEVRVEGLLAQVRLRIGDERLTAVITRDAVDELKLKRGQPALAVIKSTEVMIAREP
jgi:molybdopterin-binding protein